MAAKSHAPTKYARADTRNTDIFLMTSPFNFSLHILIRQRHQELYAPIGFILQEGLPCIAMIMLIGADVA